MVSENQFNLRQKEEPINVSYLSAYSYKMKKIMLIATTNWFQAAKMVHCPMGWSNFWPNPNVMGGWASVFSFRVGSA